MGIKPLVQFQLSNLFQLAYFLTKELQTLTVSHYGQADTYAVMPNRAYFCFLVPRNTILPCVNVNLNQEGLNFGLLISQ